MTDIAMTVEDVLVDAIENVGIDPLRIDWTNSAICDGCGRTTELFALIVDAVGITRCGQCVANDRIGGTSADPLNWNDIRAERDARLNASIWAVLPGSPLTDECQGDFASYRAYLHRVTIDFAHPDLVQWPTIPDYCFGGE